MDPKFQPVEPTFETTLTDVSKLRAHFAAQDDHDWPRYKMIVINAVTSGQRLEQRVVNAEAEIKYKLARRNKLEELEKAVTVLQETILRRKGTINWLVDHVWTILCLVLTAIVAHRWP
jgi:hypothetical protein